jgi:hypothetical protein
MLRPKMSGHEATSQLMFHSDMTYNGRQADSHKTLGINRCIDHALN